MDGGKGLAAQHGTKGTLDWVPVAKLRVDESYQRSTDGRSSGKHIAKMASAWNWHKLAPLCVSSRDGTLYVTDGQHRLLAARRAGVDELPCYIIGTEDASAEAETFVAVNKDRTGMTALAIYHAEVKAGRNDAPAVDEMMTMTGCHIPKTPPTGGRFASNVITSPGSVKACLSRYGKIHAAKAILVLKDVGEATGSWYLQATLMQAVARLCHAHGDNLGTDRLKDVIMKRSAAAWRGASQQYREVNPCSALVGMSDVLTAAYNDRFTPKLKDKP